MSRSTAKGTTAPQRGDSRIGQGSHGGGHRAIFITLRRPVMPVTIPKDLPARSLLEAENVFVMTDPRASHQDIRPLNIAILNLMPTKVQTETQLLRLLGNTPLQVNITLLHMESHESRNTSAEHLASFYDTFEHVRYRKFDGLILTGAPVENMEFHEVDYWPELVSIMDWSRTHVHSTFHICWGAQAGLWHHYGVPKHPLPEKQFGVFSHVVERPREPLVRGFDDIFPAPHSRHTGNSLEDIRKVAELDVVARSDEAGPFIMMSSDRRQIFVTGHLEYDCGTLKSEYDRDVAKNLPIKVPRNYYPDNDPSRPPVNTWRSHAHLLYANWLNYCVYQMTPFDPDMIGREGASDSSAD